jgi:hypothetical protein
MSGPTHKHSVKHSVKARTNTRIYRKTYSIVEVEEKEALRRVLEQVIPTRDEASDEPVLSRGRQQIVHLHRTTGKPPSSVGNNVPVSVPVLYCSNWRHVSVDQARVSYQ